MRNRRVRTLQANPSEQPATTIATSTDSRKRIIDTAYELFAQRGVQPVGVNEIIGRAGVAKATFYRHFPSKNDLVLAFLAEREQRWSLEFVRDEAEARGDTPTGRLLGIFDVFHDWFSRPDYEACSFINILLELGPSHPAGQASIGYLRNIRELIHRWAGQAGLREPGEFAHSLQILMKGAIIAAAEGDTDAANRARTMARLLIEDHSG